jgi:hypothetical protein
MITLNQVARPKDLDDFESDNIEIRKLRMWRDFCSYVEDDDDAFTLLVELRKVWKSLTLSKRLVFSRARDLDGAFNWANSPQGLEFWMEWNDKLYDMKEHA